jgi:hypothetical protein
MGKIKFLLCQIKVDKEGSGSSLFIRAPGFKISWDISNPPTGIDREEKVCLKCLDLSFLSETIFH